MKYQNRRYRLLLLLLIPVALYAQEECNGSTERIIGTKGALYTIPCNDMVIMDIGTYSKYRYIEKLFHKMDSTVSGYTRKLDSLDQENIRNKELLEDKIKNKEGIISRYKSHTEEITAVLEKCKADSEGFVKAYQEKVAQNQVLDHQVKKLKHQRKGFLGISGGLAAALVLIILL